MKLYMKQKVFSFKDRFSIKNEYEEDRYYIEGEIFSLGKKLHIYDTDGQELAFVRQELLTLMPKFSVETDGRQVARIVKKFSFMRPKYYIEGLGWEVNGDVFAHNYSITENGREIITIHKIFMSWGDSFVLEIDENQDEVTALAVVLAIDAVLDSQTQSY